MLANMERLAAWLKHAACMAALALACLSARARRRSRRFQPRGRGGDEPSPGRRRLSAHRQYRSRQGRNRWVARSLGGRSAPCPGPRPFAIRSATPERSSRSPPQLVGISLVLNLGRAGCRARIARHIRKMVSDLRRENGVTVLADCVLDANVGNGCPVRDRSGTGLGKCGRGRVSRTPRNAAALRRHGAAWHSRSCRVSPPDRRSAGEPRAVSEGDRDARRRSPAPADDRVALVR